MNSPLSLLLALALQDVPVVPVAAAPPAERLSIGGSATLILVMPCFLPTIRVSAPLGRHLGVDIDAGPTLFWGNREIGQVPDGLAIDTQLRWLRSGRKPDGNGRYWLFGGSYVEGRRVLRGEILRNYAIRNFQVGYGWDNLARGFRTGVEIKVSPIGDGEGLARLFVVWGRR